MAHPPSTVEPHRPLKPVPIISVGEAPRPIDEANRDDDSMRPVTGPSGFASDATSVAVTGIPWEKRPLSRRGVLGWTIASMTAMVLVVTTVAVALARSASHSAASVAPHGAEAADVVPAERPAPAPASPANATPSAAAQGPVIPLSALPKVETTKPRSSTAHGTRRSTATAAPSKKAHASKTVKTKPNATGR
jgi:hypothetical protein